MNNIIDRDLWWIIFSNSRSWLYVRKITIKGQNFLESKTHEAGNRDNERGRCPRRVRRKRLLIFTIMQRARSGSIREKSPERKNSRCLAKSADSTVPRYLFCKNAFRVQNPSKVPVDDAGARFAGTCPHRAFHSFWNPHCPRTCICTW